MQERWLSDIDINFNNLLVIIVAIVISYFIYKSFYSVVSHASIKSYLIRASFDDIYGNKTNIFILLKNETNIGSNVIINEMITFNNGTSKTYKIPFALQMASKSGGGFLYDFATTNFPAISNNSQSIKISNVFIISDNYIIESENNSITYSSYYYTKSSLENVPLYYLNMSATPLGAGNLTPGNGYYYAGSKVAISEKPNIGYAFSGWSGFGDGNYTGPNKTAIIEMNSNITEYAKYVKLVKMYVNATYNGIPVYVNGVLNTTTNGTVYLMPGLKYTLSLPRYITISNGTKYVFESMQNDCGISISPNSNYTTFVPSYANYNCKFTANYELPFIFLYISNYQHVATPIPFQQMIAFNPSSYAQYENSNLGNIRFYQGSIELHSWCESGCSNVSSQAIFWINLPSGISANSSVTLEMRFEPPATNYDGVYAGKADYGKYDNGAYVFPYYQLWAGLTELPSNWHLINGTNISYTTMYTDIMPSSSTSGWYGVYLNPIPSSLSSIPTVWEMYGNIYDSIQIPNHIPVVYNPTSYDGNGDVIFSQNTVLNGDIIGYNVTIDNNVTLITNGYSIIAFDNFINNGTIDTGVGTEGGYGAVYGYSACYNGGSITTSYGGSGGGGGGSGGCSGGSTIVSGGGGGTSGCDNNLINGGNGGTPYAPTLNNQMIQTWYNNGMQNYLEGAGGGGGGTTTCTVGYGGNGGSGGGGIYIQATNLIAGTINANGQNGGNSYYYAGGAGGGGGGSILLAYGSKYIAGRYSTSGGSGGLGLYASNGGAGGSGQILLYHYTIPPISPSAGSIAVGTDNTTNKFDGYVFSEGNTTPNVIYLGNAGEQYYASTGYKDTNNNKVYTMQMNSATSLQMFINYTQIYSTISAVAENPTYFGIYTSNNGGSDIPPPVYIYWLRARAYPPNGVMPSVKFGSLQ